MGCFDGPLIPLQQGGLGGDAVRDDEAAVVHALDGGADSWNTPGVFKNFVDIPGGEKSAVEDFPDLGYTIFDIDFFRGTKGGSAMSGRAGGKSWSASVLRRRGWTNELMKQLLPKPRILMSNGRPIRMWSQEEVRRAEQDSSFAQAKKDPELRGAALRAAAPGVRHARGLRLRPGRRRRGTRPPPGCWRDTTTPPSWPGWPRCPGAGPLTRTNPSDRCGSSCPWRRTAPASGCWRC